MNITKQKYLNAATRIAHSLCRDAVWADDRCNWITSGMEDHTGTYPKTFFRSLDADMYAGTSGVAYFLSSIYTVCPDPVIKATAYGAMRQALSYLPKMNKKFSMGFYVGKLGVAYAAIRAGQNLEAKELIDNGIALLQECFDQPLDECSLDVIDGLAGAIPVLLNLFDDTAIDKLASWSIGIGDHLIRLKKPEPVGISWDTTPYKKENLTGFAHGTAGIANALFELYHFTGNDKYKKAGEDAFAYENFHFINEEQNWPDFRSFGVLRSEEDQKNRCACAWCHGAPGIGLARLRAYELTGHAAHKEDAMISINTTIKNNKPSPYSNFSLCHGLFGNLDLLLEASRIFDSREWQQEIEATADYGIRHYINESIPFLNGVNNSYENPELMTGMSGMGYFYLRMYNAELFPSILRVQPKSHSVVQQMASA